MHEAAQIRHAIERGDFGGALVMWETWAESGIGPAEREEMAELYRWGRPALLCARMQILSLLNNLHAAGAYGAAAPVESGLVSGSF